jgi:hypothetical protein
MPSGFLSAGSASSSSLRLQGPPVHQDIIECWYRVVDAQGHNLNDIGVQTLYLSLNSRIVGVRKAVKLENPTILASVESGFLKVFKSKLAFDRGEEPLKASAFLDATFGRDEENALIILVPSPSICTSVSRLDFRSS